MQHTVRLIFLPLLATALTGRIWATEDAPPTAKIAPAEYKRSDTNFYPKAAFIKDHPTAVIIPYGGYTQKDDSYFFTPKIRAPKDIYFEVLNDWIEPITPPDMPASLGVPPDAMQIREPQGDVRVALPSAPTNFSPVTAGMTLPDGAVLKTGANGTAAVLFGGVDSARLMPNSEAAVQQTVTTQSRAAEVDLTTGGVFSKVGTQVGVTGDYEVHTPYGNASAQGGDFVTIISGSHTDVWIAQGKVDLVNPSETKSAATATADGTGPLKILRDPGLANPHLSMLADTETLTTLLNFIPLANQKIKALRDKMAGGTALTANEQAYLNRIKQVPSLIKLALVPPPAPPVAATPPPAAAPAPEPPPAAIAATPASSVPPPVKLKPIELNLRPDGNVDFQNTTLTLDELKPKLEEIAKATPTQRLVIPDREKAAPDQLKKVLAICAAAKLKVVRIHKPQIHAPPVAPAVAEPAAANPPPPAAAVPPQVPAPVPAPTPASAADATPPPASPTDLKPIRAVVRIDGKINFQGATYDLPGFKSKLEALVKATPDQSIVIRAGKTVPYEKLKPVFDVCRDANVKYISAATPAPATPPVAPATTEPAAANLPTPGLLMHPSMEPASSNAPPTAPTPPTTNAPPPAGP